jgi:hypothetical protein
MAWALLGGCANPISNEVLNADEQFLAALPSTDRVGFTGPFRGLGADEDDDPVLRHGLEIADDLDALLSLMTGVSDILRTSTPSTRTDTNRDWEARSIVAPDDATADLWWVRASIVRASAEADLLWSIEGSASADGPWVEVGSGRHDPDGIGDLFWDFEATGEVFGTDLPGVLEVDYDESTPDREVDLTVFFTDGSLPAQFGLFGRNAFTWTGDFTLTDDGLTWPGGAAIVVLDTGAGRSIGGIELLDGPLEFESCWASTGQTTWLEATTVGDVTIPAVGEEADCVVPDVLD